MNKFLKKLFFILSLLLSPMIMLALLSMVYITFKLLGGFEFKAALSSFQAALHSLIPYFPYLTIIPAALFILACLIKNKIKVINTRK